MTDVLTAKRGSVYWITINREARRNAMNDTVTDAIAVGLTAASADPDVRAVVLTGAGRAFCVGQDLREHVEALRDGSPAPLSTVEAHYNPIVAGLIGMPKPVIAAVNGSAAGAGAGIACAADFRFASTSATFLLAFANVGLTLDSGLSWTLPRIVGSARATALALLAEPVQADVALEMGMVNAVLEPEHLLPAAQELAARLAAGPTAAYAAIKAALAFGASASLADALAMEGRLQAEVGASADHRAAVEAFLAKQKPVFSGR